MKNIYKDQQGFGAVEALLILVIVVIIGAVGFFVYHSNKNANSTIDTANQSNSNAQSINRTSTKTAVAAGTKAKSVATDLLVFSKTDSKASLKSYVDKHVNDGRFTAAFKLAADSGAALPTGNVNPIYCSTTVPTGLKVASTKLNGDTAVVTLSQVSTSKVVEAQVPQLTLQYAKNAFSVSLYDCVTNPVTGQ